MPGSSLPGGHIKASLLKVAHRGNTLRKSQSLQPPPSGQVWKSYYFAGSVRIAMRVQVNGVGDKVYYLLADHLGSTAITVGENNSKHAELRYAPWGTTRYAWGDTPTDYKYTGQREAAGIGLYFYQSRFYDASLGRFAQADKIIPEQSQGVQAWDRYSYVNNNPISKTDPTGHMLTDGCSQGECSGEKSTQPPLPTPVPPSYSPSPSSAGSSETLTSRAMKGDFIALLQLIIPSHLGGRLQLEVSFDIGIGLSGTVGVNLVYNRISDQLAGNVDWAFEPGIGIGTGASGTGGLLIGWGSSSIDDVTKGYSGIISGTAAAESAVSVGIIAPIDENGLHVDPYSGQVPATAYVGGGGGGAYASIGGGINGPTGIYTDLTSILPWHWSK